MQDQSRNGRPETSVEVENIDDLHRMIEDYHVIQESMQISHTSMRIFTLLSLGTFYLSTAQKHERI